MRGNGSVQKKILAGGAALFMIAAVVGWHLQKQSVSPQALPYLATTPPVQPPNAVGVPAYLMIPGIRLDAAIETVGLTKDGAMDVPTQALDAGWYEWGPRPGEIGDAVIAGHLNWLHGATGVFENLHNLKPGDTLTVQDAAGTDVSFVVRKTQTYAAEEDATNVFVSNDGEAHLNLVTCDGTWDKKTSQYTTRLVVFTDRQTP